MSFNTPLHFEAPAPSLVWGLFGIASGGYALVWSVATRRSARILPLKRRLKWTAATALVASVGGWFFQETPLFESLTASLAELLVALAFLGVLLLTPVAVLILGALGLSLAVPFFLSRLFGVRLLIYPLHLLTWAYAWFCLAVNFALRS